MTVGSGLGAPLAGFAADRAGAVGGLPRGRASVGAGAGRAGPAALSRSPAPAAGRRRRRGAAAEYRRAPAC